MIAKVSIQLLILFAMRIVCIYSNEYILEDLLAMEDRSTVQNVETINVNNDGEPQKNTRQRQTFSARQKKADEGDNGVEKVANTNENGARKSNKDDEDEDKKTLAQQVADGKYGLIQKEIFEEAPKRPGIISYEVNPEVPRDNVNNLGGLKPEEIWLAENHLLVLAGGGKYNEDRDNSPAWPPIDNYRAPPRQVKIPPNPKVPPPFPVQLRPGGPTEFIRGENGTGGPPQYPPLFPPVNFSGTGPPPSPFFAPPPGFHPGNFTPGNGPVTPFPYQFPQPPPGIRNGSIPRLPPPGLFPPGLPPGSNFLPPPGNITEQFDEDDPSIYYPPPYDFVYKRENTTAIPPGPLVPGIVLPPPPDFFAPLEDEKRPKPKRPVHKSKRPLQIPTDYRGKSEYRFPSTTKRPSLQIVTDEPSHPSHLNEVTPETVQHVLPPNAEVRGWVPIPAPRPFYITGPRKPVVKNSNLENIRNNGYQFHKPYPDLPIVEQQLTNGWNFIDNRSQPISFNANYEESGQREGNIIIIPTTKISPVPYQSTQAPSKVPSNGRGKAVKSYYFYDEPPRLISTQPSLPLGSIYSTPRPLIKNPQYFTTTVPTPSPRPFQSELPASPAPVQYFYITKRPQPIQTTTSKPPIYEYSYTAPGYGTLEAPRLTGVSTPAPPVHQVAPIPQYDLNNYYQLYDAPQTSTREPAGFTFSTTAAPPIVTKQTTIRPETYEHTPKFNSKPTSSPYIVQTENPYHAYFTHHDFSLIDDITKKYFTIFGQKINQAEGVTTPLSPVISVDDITTKASVQKHRNKVKFPIDQHQTSAPAGPNDYSYYWNSQRPPSASGPGQNVYSQYPSEYDYYDDVNSNYNGQNDYRYKYLQDLYNFNGGRHSAALVQQQQSQPSYEGDTRVNFVQPLPSKDSEAEEFQTVPLKNRNQPSQLIQNNYSGSTQTNTEPTPSLQDDTKVNYVNPPATPDPDAEVFDPTKLKFGYRSHDNSFGGRSQSNVVTLRPHLLHDDTRVNYINPQPNQDPDAELYDPAQLNLGYRSRGNRPSSYYKFGKSPQQGQQSQQLAGLVQSPAPPSSKPPPSLEGDTSVNYLHPRPPINPDAELFNPNTRQQIIAKLFNEFVGRSQATLRDDTKVNDALTGQAPDPDALVFDPKKPPSPDFGGRTGHSDIIAYRLPGNGGGHFYFLTPQTAIQQDVNYQTQDSSQQNLFRRNVRRQSGNQQEQTEEDTQKAEVERERQTRNRMEERRRRTNINRNNSNKRNNDDNHRT